MIPIIFSAEGRMNTKRKRQQEYKKNLNSYPNTYKTNSTKEELCYEYIRTFNDQFKVLYPNRKIPYMTTENECGTSKFVSNFIHPSHATHTELYDLHECASYFSGFIQYEPLDPLNEPPSVILSPTKTLDCHIGDCFDISTLLASFLIGSGYNAYVVNGYAPKYIALKDQSMTACPIASGPRTHQSQKILSQLSENAARRQSVTEETFPENAKPTVNGYTLMENPVLDSRYIKEEAEKQKEASKDPFRLWIQDELPEKIDESHLTTCVHSWILIVSGHRDIKENLFIEPATGKVYNITNCPFYGIESIWNNTNYWINLQNNKSPKEMDFDLMNTMTWECLFLPSKNIKSTGINTSSLSNANDANDDESTPVHRIPINSYNIENMNSISSTISSINLYRTLDAPTTWVEPLKLSREKYYLRYPPYGKRTITYYCCKVDFYSRILYTNTSNMTMRITQYLDKNYTIVKNITEYYENRKDKLYKRIRNNINTDINNLHINNNSNMINTYHFIEHYHPGNYGEMKQYVEYPGKYIAIDFYVDGRLDRMNKREEFIGYRIIEYFSKRTDYLLQRSMILTLDVNLVGNRIFSLPVGLTSNVSTTSVSNESESVLTASTILSTIKTSKNKSNSKKSANASNNTASNSVMNSPNTFNNTTNNVIYGKDYYILSMNQLYDINPSNNNHSNEIYQRYFNIPDGKLVIQYHHDINNINRKVETFYHAKNGLLTSSNNNNNDNIYNILTSQDSNLNDKYELLQDAVVSERDCYTQLKLSYININKVYEVHNDNENINISFNVNRIERTVYDIALDKSYNMNLFTNTTTATTNTANKNNADNNLNNKSIDYLTPYLKNYDDINNLTKEQIDDIKQRCKEALQARIIERTNIIQNRLNDENTKLVRKQEQFQRSQRDGDFSTEEYEKYCTDAMFRIQILERRLFTYKETALARFAELDHKLQTDPRLKVSKV